VKKIDSSALLEGALDFVSYVKEHAIKTAIGSSSKNTNLILKQTGIDSLFDIIVDGNYIKNSKPDPEVFLKAAELLGIPSSECLVCEDADAGVEAAINAGMHVLAVGYAKDNKKATFSALNLKEALYKADIR
ncbi:MAG: HAD-IA family hydrolase, partial [Firmicutes bacterium]|nr:HAD-IA family hydrolase [Bacillota bacterium]